jgi:hypothetical protein
VVVGANSPSPNVTWSVAGSVAGTAFNNGNDKSVTSKLTVAEAQDRDLTVKATSVTDTTKFATYLLKKSALFAKAENLPTAVGVTRLDPSHEAEMYEGAGEPATLKYFYDAYRGDAPNLANQYLAVRYGRTAQTTTLLYAEIGNTAGKVYSREGAAGTSAASRRGAFSWSYRDYTNGKAGNGSTTVDFTTAIPPVYATNSPAFNGTGSTNWAAIETQNGNKIAPAGSYYAKVVLVSSSVKEEFSTSFEITGADVLAAAYEE